VLRVFKKRKNAKEAGGVDTGGDERPVAGLQGQQRNDEESDAQDYY
jgi:hypothetical protein